MKGMPWRDQLATAVITAIVTLFGVILIQTSGTLGVVAGMADDGEGAVGAAFRVVSWVFIGLACYTAAVVTANVFTTLVAGRVRLIAQYRLLGAAANKLRRWLALEGLGAALLGGSVGFGAGIGLSWMAVGWLVDDGKLPPLAYPPVQPDAVLPALLGIVTVVVAAWVGSRQVARVAPVQALSVMVEAPAERGRISRARILLFWFVMLPGLALMGIGVMWGIRSPNGLLVAFFGGMFSFTALIIGAPAVIPWLLRGVGRLLGKSVPAQLARENAVRQPRSATRGTIGMVIGVTLVVMFIVAVESFRTRTASFVSQAVASGEGSPETVEMVNAVLNTIVAVMVGLTAVSGLLAAIGMIANLSLQVMQRRRELGLLRAVGATASQVRSSIALEAAIMSVVAIGAGTVLGVFYGWVGAQSTLGSMENNLFPPTVPWQLLLAVAGASVLLATVTATGPAIRSTRTSPLDALRIA